MCQLGETVLLAVPLINRRNTLLGELAPKAEAVINSIQTSLTEVVSENST
jgi:hypothetical protein